MRRIACVVPMVLVLAFAAFGDERANATRGQREQENEIREAAEQRARVAKKAAKNGPRLSAAGRRTASRFPGSGNAQTTIDATPPPPTAVVPVLTRNLRDLPVIPPPNDRRRGEGHPEPIRPKPPVQDGPDTARQTVPGALVSAPTATGVSFEGVGVGLAGFTVNGAPPDTNGRAGATQYVQWNNTSFAVWSKTGTLLYGPAAGNTLFQSLGGACATHNDGDPVVTYDILAGRWVLSQFVVGASPNYSHQCVAVSTSGDATGSYYVYDFVTDATNFVDYPHLSVWPDGYYMSAHVFNQAGDTYVAGRVYVFERSKMLSGLSAQMVSGNLPNVAGQSQYGFLAADVDSLTPPPTGEAEFILGPDPGLTTRVDSTRATVNWTTPSLTFSNTTRVHVTSLPAGKCASGVTADGRDCVPQPSPAVGTDYLDGIDFHFMNRLAYRNFGGSPIQESLVATQTGGSTAGGDHDVLRWYEFQHDGTTGAPSLFQESTLDPDTAWRWIGSIAMDKDHNIALGYSKSSTSIKPGIYMTGRLFSDTINTMGAETTVMAGGGVQLGTGNRWGDYSAMALDPVDQCTFWYTNEYYPADGSFAWATRIAAYKFPSCTASAAWGTISGNITSCATGLPMSGVVVTLSNGFAGQSDASGNYSIVVPAGTYTATATDTDRNCTTSTPSSPSLLVTSGGTLNQNFCMTGNSNLQFNSVAIDDSTAGNNNGVVNANECFAVNVNVKNNGCANESAISATLTTNTAGVTIQQGSSAYPALVIDANGGNATPFRVQTSSTFVCGTTINFTLNLTYASGSKSVGFTVPTCSGGANQTIPSSAITLGDSTQTDRLGRDGNASTCAGKTCPAGIGTAGTRNYKTFNFTNSGGAPACITVQISAACGVGGSAGDISSSAYLGSFNSANLCNNYLGDSGISGLGTTAPSGSYTFEVPAASNFVVVVGTNTGSTTCTQFSGIVSGFFDFTPATVTSAPTISTNDPTTFCAGGSALLSSNSATGNQWYLNGVAINGQTGQTYSATASGSYTATVTTDYCTSPASNAIAITVNPIPSTPTASNGGPYCEGATIQLSTPTVSGATYAWTGPNGFTSANQNPTRTNATTADAGTYSVTVTVNGCTSAAGTTNVVVNATPATPAASNGGPYCEGATIQLSTPTVGGATYAWTGPNGFTSANQNPTRTNATTADAGTYSVTITVSGCTSAAGTTNVVVNPIPATPTASNGGPYCEGATIQLSTPTVGSATYSWTGPNGFTSSDQNPTRTNATTADAGTYSVTITVSGCTSAAGTTDVVVNPIPATPTASNGGPYCEGATIQLSTPTVGGATYSWTGPNGFTSSDQNPTRTNATTADAGTYSVTITVSGCTSAAGTTNVVVNATPATPTASNGGPYCEGATIQLSTPTVGGATYSWTGPNGFTSTDQNPTRTNATTADAGTYSVTITVSGCTSAAGTTNVVVNPIPATPTATNGGPYCEGATIQLFTPTVSGATYSWTGPNSFTSSAQNPTRANAALGDAGTYSVTITVDGCTSAAGTTNVVVNATPATPTASNGGPYCEGATIQLSTPTVSGATYSWTGPNGFTSANQNPTRTNATVADAGTYSVTITVNGCTSAAGTTNVVVNATPGTPTASNGGPYCTGATIQLSTPTVGGATYSWTGPNGFTSSSQNPTRTNAAVADAGTYSVTITVNGCTSAAGTTNVVVSSGPATPAISAGGPTTFCEGGSVQLTSNSATGNQWYVDNNIINGATNQTYAATTSGSYTVVVNNGCSSAPSNAIVVTVNPVPATPTITPNGPTTFCEGSNVILTSSSASGNQWYFNGNALTGSTGQGLIAANTGSYSVRVTSNGCTSDFASPIFVTVNPKPDATITATSPIFLGASSTASVSVYCVGATYAWSVTGGTITSGQGTRAIQFTATSVGTLTITVTVTNAYGCSDTKMANVTVNQATFGAPPWMRANATSTTSVGVQWAAVTSADHYEVFRSTDGVNFTLQGSPVVTTFSQSGLTPSTTYFYKVRAVNAVATTTAFSAVDPATTFTFTDDPLTSACPPIVKAVHITQLRTAINIARAAVGLSAFAFTDPSLAAGNTIKAIHITELRTAVTAVYTAIGAAAPTFTDPTLTVGVTTVKGAHVTDLRDLIR